MYYNILLLRMIYSYVLTRIILSTDTVWITSCSDSFSVALPCQTQQVTSTQAREMTSLLAIISYRLYLILRICKNNSKLNFDWVGGMKVKLVLQTISCSC